MHKTVIAFMGTSKNRLHSSWSQWVFQGALILLTISCSAQHFALNWENREGNTFKGIYQNQYEGKAIIERSEDEQKFLVPLNHFSQSSRDRALVYMNEDPFTEKVNSAGENLIENPEFQDRGNQWKFDVEGADYDYVSAASLDFTSEDVHPDDIILAVERNPNAMIIDYSEVYQDIPIENSNALLVVSVDLAYEGMDMGGSDYFAVRVSGDQLYRIWDETEEEPEESYPTVYAKLPTNSAWHTVQLLVDLSPLESDSVNVHVATKVTSGTFYIRSINAFTKPY